MSAIDYQDLLRHVGHEIVCVTYAGGENVAIECEDCNEVLLDFNRDEDPGAGGEARPAGQEEGRQAVPKPLTQRAPDSVCWTVDPVDLAVAMEKHLKAKFGLHAEDFLSLRFDDEYPEVCEVRIDADALSKNELRRLEAAGLAIDEPCLLLDQLLEDLWGLKGARGFAVGELVEVQVPYQAYRQSQAGKSGVKSGHGQLVSGVWRLTTVTCADDPIRVLHFCIWAEGTVHISPAAYEQACRACEGLRPDDPWRIMRAVAYDAATCSYYFNPSLGAEHLGKLVELIGTLARCKDVAGTDVVACYEDTEPGGSIYWCYVQPGRWACVPVSPPSPEQVEGWCAPPVAEAVRSKI